MTWQLHARAVTVATAGIVAGVLAPVHQAPLVTVLAGIAIVALVAVPVRSRGLHALIAAGLGAGISAALMDRLALAALAGVVGAGLALARLEHPTHQERRLTRSLALFAPAGLTGGAFLLAAATSRFDAVPAGDGLRWGVGLAGVGVLACTSGLGLATLLDSEAPQQRGAWTALAAGAAVVAASLATRDPSAVLARLAVLAGPAGVLSAIAARRLARSTPGIPAWAGYLGLAAAVVATWGLTVS